VDDTVRGQVEAWLAGAGVEPPKRIELSIALVPGAWGGRDERAFLRQPDLRFHHGPPEGIRIVWRDGAGHAVLAPDGSAAAAVELWSEVAREPDQWLRPFLLPVLLALLRRAGWHHIHAATARDPAGRGWLIAGDARTGKSTTAALLASRGWAVGTDDTAFLAAGPGGVEAMSWRAPLALRDAGLALLARGGGVSLERRRKTGFSPEDLGSTWLPRVTLDVVALAGVHAGATRVEPVSRTAAVADLLSWSLLFVIEPADAQRHLDLVARLVRQARCVRVRFGPDLFEHHDLLSELIA
jgi:hypothetical protein